MNALDLAKPFRTIRLILSRVREVLTKVTINGYIEQNNSNEAVTVSKTKTRHLPVLFSKDIELFREYNAERNGTLFWIVTPTEIISLDRPIDREPDLTWRWRQTLRCLLL